MAPGAPLGAGFGRLWTASVASNLADGLSRTAIPLIATTLTTDPLLIAGIGALTFLPWLLFGVLSGVVVDRVDRRRTMGLANAIRTLAALAVVASALTGTLTIWLLYVCILAFGIGETFYDNSTIAMVPSLVGKSGLERANGRMQASDLVVQNFVATPITGFLFVAAISLPLVPTALGYLLAAALALTLPLAAGRAAAPLSASVAAGPAAGVVATVRGDIAEGLRFLIGHRFLRSMVLFTSAVGLLIAFAQSIVVLFVLQTLDVPDFGFGIVTAIVGLGALAGALCATALVRRFGRGRILVAGTVLGGLGLLATGLSPNVWVAVPMYMVSAFGIAIWNVPWGALRQDIIPGHLLGRLIGTIRTLTWGVMPIGALIGGFVGRIDLRLPFIIGGALTVIVSIAATKLLLLADSHSSPEGDENVGGAA
jgi:MFS family permease